MHGTDADKLDSVIAEMRVLGAPTIRYVDVAGTAYAVEGTHRLAAAAALGLVPELVELPYEGKVPDDVDADDFGLCGRDVSELAEYVARHREGGESYEF